MRKQTLVVVELSSRVLTAAIYGTLRVTRPGCWRCCRWLCSADSGYATVWRPSVRLSRDGENPTHGKIGGLSVVRD